MFDGHMFDPMLRNVVGASLPRSTPMFPRIYSGAGWEGFPDGDSRRPEAVPANTPTQWLSKAARHEAAQHEIKVGDLVECLDDAEWIEGGELARRQVGKQAVVRYLAVRLGREVVGFELGVGIDFLWPVDALKKVPLK